MEERAQRIVDAAIELAEEGGFQNVRLRDVAAQSGVALGTLYARFSSKEDILMAALDQETQKFETLLSQFPLEGDGPLERVNYFFGITSRALFDRPNFAKAVLRSVASGDPSIAEKVISYQDRMTRMIVLALLGDAAEQGTDNDIIVSSLLQDIWFGALVGWMSETKTEEAVLEQMNIAATMLLRGIGRLAAAS